MVVRLVALWLLCLGLAPLRPVLAQDASGAGAGRADSSAVAELGVYRDTLDVAQPQPFVLRTFVLPGSERILLNDALLDSTAYRIDYRHGRLWLHDAPPPEARLVAVYRTFPFEQFKDVYRRRRMAPPDTAGAAAVVEEETAAVRTTDPFGNTQLQRSGSITRGILAGNNRDVSVESGLRMQLAGEVVDGVTVQAVLTDENTPIQPEGTTQRLNEFDRVYIQLQAQQGVAQLGDFDLVFTGTEFARFNRKLQGISLQADVPETRGALLGGGSAVVAGATSRGLFRTQTIEPIDGVQGPYRLEGREGEQFIIVIAGSEAVYLDGQRLVRGEANDYVIDYQTGELTFTPQRLITEDRRILVEFQYTTTEFTRTLLGTQAQAGLWQREGGTARLRLGATVLREADSRDFNAELGLTGRDSLLLVEAGDAHATRSGAERVVFDPEAPYAQYTREVQGGPGGAADTVFVALRSAPPDSVPVYRVRFSRVGEGQGRYVRAGRSVNGILYEYRGAGRGAYEPVRLLPKPEQQRLVDLHGAFEPLPGLELFGEWARSLNDENRLSARDVADDTGDAYLAGLRLQPTPLVLGDLDLGQLSAEFRRRYTSTYFTAFDRTRPVEFGRRWNLVSRGSSFAGDVAEGTEEATDEAYVQLAVTPQTVLRGELGRIGLGEAFEGTRRAATLAVEEAGLPQLSYQVEHIESRDTLLQEQGTWLRQLGTLQQPLLGSRFVPRLEVEQERRRQRVLGTDSLARASFAFVEYRPGLAWVGERLDVGGSVELRTEEDWLGGALRPAARAWTVQSAAHYRPSAVLDTEATLGYRVRRYREVFRREQQRENTESVVLQWNGRLRPLGRAVEANWFYEALTERTPTLQEIYVRTGPELGQYVWEDGNGDGIVQVDEFLPERTPNEGLYVRTFIPSDSLASIVSVQARLRLQLDPARRWREADRRWQRLLAQVSMRTTLEVQEKSREQDLAQIYLLNLQRFRSPVTTLNGRLRVAQEVTLFRDRPRYGFDVRFDHLQGLNELAAGEEQRFVNSWSTEGRYRPTTRWGLRMAAAVGHNRVESEAFASRRYDIASRSVAPEVSFNPSRALQLTAGADWARKEDAVGDRQARVLKLPVEGRYMQARRLQLTARGEMARVALTGDAVGLAQFELTDGRGPGTSYLWGLTGQYAFNSYLRASFSYDGRAPARAPVLHTVRLQLSAVF